MVSAMASTMLSVMVALLPGCTSTTACSQADCQSEAIVTFPPNLVSGAFDLVIDGDESVTLRCLDPSAPETADNPDGITCNAQGFTIDGHPLANEREVLVIVIPTDGSEEQSALVRLDAIETITPNGPDCPPTCVLRNGRFEPTGAG